jgi:O-antigen/teichoic acid export membrane protein
MRWKDRFWFTALTYAEHGAIRLFDALVTLLLIQVLTVDSFSAFSIYQSWIAVFMLVFPALENALYRGYASIKSNNELPGLIATLRAYNLFRFALAFALALILSFVPQPPLSWLARFAALLFAFALPLSHALYACYRELMRFELKQRPVSLVTLVQKMALAGGIALVGYLVGGRVSFIAAIGTLILVLFYFVWQKTAVVSLGPSWVKNWHEPLPSIRKLLMRSSKLLKSAVLWMHINGSVTAAVQTLDVLFLGICKYTTKEIALYSLALKGANFFQSALIPLGQVALVKISRTEINEANKNKAIQVTLWAAIVFSFFSAILFLVGSIFAEHIVEFLSRGRFLQSDIDYNVKVFKWLLGGVCIYSLCFVPGAYLSAIGNIRFLSMGVFIPWLLVSATCYGLAAPKGLLPLAKMNLVVYGFLVAGHYVAMALEHRRPKAKASHEFSI